MQQLDDIGLLGNYVDHASEEAFAALVARHINKVYSIALRRTGNPHHAEEITQAVFVILAKKSRQLPKTVILSGWLCRTAQLTAVTFLRSEIRRARREQEAQMQRAADESESDAWLQISPVLDAAMAGLNETDHHAIVLRFFDGKSMKEVAAALGASEESARKRVSRAVEKLRRFFTKRGVVFSAAVLTAAISSNSVQAAPAVLAKTAVAGAIAKGAAVSGSNATLVKGALKLMAWTKAKTAIIAGTVILLGAGTATVAIKELAPTTVDDKWFEFANLEKAPPDLAAIRPTKFASDRFSGIVSRNPGRQLGNNLQFRYLIAHAYDEPTAERGFSVVRTSCSEPWPEQKFDYVITSPGNPRLQLQTLIRKELGFEATREPREQDVLLLKVRTRGAPGLKPTSGAGPFESFNTPGKLCCTNKPIQLLAGRLETMFDVPVVDQTGLNGNYDFVLDFPLISQLAPVARKDAARNTVRTSLLNHLGLELVPSRETVEMLVVKRTSPR